MGRDPRRRRRLNHELPLPPILLTPGLRLESWGTTDDGSYFALVSRRPKRMIVIYVYGANVVFEYTMLDPATKTMTTYRGHHGDPEFDQRLRISGLESTET